MRGFTLLWLARRDALVTRAQTGNPSFWRSVATLVLAIVAISAVILSARPATAAVGINKQISFQGKLVNTNGTNIADGTYNLEFKIYTGGAGTAAGNPGGSLVWTEDRLISVTNGVTVSNGIFQVNLGSVTALPTSFNNDTVWLSIQLGSTSTCTITTTFTANCGGDGEMLPMVRFTAAPYALNSDNLGGIASTGFVQLGQGSIQAVSTASSAIAVNQTSTGNLLQLQSAGTDAFTLTSAGNQIFGNNASHTISVTAPASNVAGLALTVSASAGGAGASVAAGGNLVLQGGAGGGTNSAGGNATIDGGVGSGTGAKGFVVLQGAGGNVGIGSTSPSSLLSVGASNQFQVSSTGSVLAQTSTNSATAFQVQSAAGAQTLLSANTVIRAAGTAGNVITIGDATGTDLDTTILKVDSATADPTTNLASLNGGLFYNSTAGKLKVIEAGVVKTLCNTTDLGCGTGGGGSTLQGAYTASTGGTTPEILLDTTRGGLDIQDANTTIGATASLLAVRASATATTLGTSLFTVQAYGTVGVGIAAPTSVLHVVVPNGANGAVGSVGGASAKQALQISGGNGGNGYSDLASDAGSGGAGSSLNLLGGAGGNGADGNGYLAGSGGNGGNITLQAGTGGTGGIDTCGGSCGGNGAAGVRGSVALQASGGNVGIGTATPTRTLDVTGSWGGDQYTRATDTTNANTTYADTTTGHLVYYLSSNKAATNSSATATYNLTGLPAVNGTFVFITAKASHNASIGASAQQCVAVQINGTAVTNATAVCDTAGNTASSVFESFIAARVNGTWMAMGAKATGTSLSAADLAEWIKFNGQKPEAGELLTTGDASVTVKRSATAYDSKLIGVVTTAPHTILGEQTPDSVAVALAGRVPVKIASDSEPIQPGDYLTSSNQPGRATKATRAGQMIGKALEAWTPGNNQDSIVAFVTTSYADPVDHTILQASNGSYDSLMVAGETKTGSLTVSGQTTTNTLTVTGVATISTLTVVNAITTKDLTVSGTATIIALKVTGDTSVQNLFVGGKLVSQGAKPTITAGAALTGVLGASVTNSGTDTAGTVSISSGSQVAQTGVLAELTFSSSYTASPKIVLSGNNSKSAKLGVYAERTATGFKIKSDDPLVQNTTYEFDYIIIAATN